MDSAAYLESYGWTQGEALKKGGLKKPILVKHKKDTKGLGCTSDDQEAWWERLFDGQLKSLDVSLSSHKGDDIIFNQKEVKPSGVSHQLSPLYRMFIRGGVLEGTIEAKKKIDKFNKRQREDENGTGQESILDAKKPKCKCASTKEDKNESKKKKKRKPSTNEIEAESVSDSPASRKSKRQGSKRNPDSVRSSVEESWMSELVRDMKRQAAKA